MTYGWGFFPWRSKVVRDPLRLLNRHIVLASMSAPLKGCAVEKIKIIEKYKYAGIRREKEWQRVWNPVFPRQILHLKQNALRRLGRHNPKLKDFRRKQKKVDNNPAIRGFFLCVFFSPSKQSSKCVIGAVWWAEAQIIFRGNPALVCGRSSGNAGRREKRTNPHWDPALVWLNNLLNAGGDLLSRRGAPNVSLISQLLLK